MPYICTTSSIILGYKENNKVCCLPFCFLITLAIMSCVLRASSFALGFVFLLSFMPSSSSLSCGDPSLPDQGQVSFIPSDPRLSLLTPSSFASCAFSASDGIAVSLASLSQMPSSIFLHGKKFKRSRYLCGTETHSLTTVEPELNLFFLQQLCFPAGCCNSRRAQRKVILSNLLIL